MRRIDGGAEREHADEQGSCHHAGILTPPPDPVNRRRTAQAFGALAIGVGFCCWQPLPFAFTVERTFTAVALRGWPLAAGLAFRATASLVGMAAGVALLSGQPLDMGLVPGALTLSALTDALIYGTSVFPNNRMPGQTPVFVAASVLYHVACATCLLRVRRRPAPEQ